MRASKGCGMLPWPPRRLRVTAAATCLGLLFGACASTRGGESRIDGTGGGEAAREEAERLSPTAGLEGGVGGGTDPGAASGGPGAGLGDLVAGLPGGSGGADPSGQTLPADLSGLPGAQDVLALIRGTLTGTYTVDYSVEPSVIANMRVNNAPGRQSIHSVARNGEQRWSLYEAGKLSVECEAPSDAGWSCTRVTPGRTPKGGLGFTFDPERLVVGLSAVQINPALILILLTPPLEGTQGVATNSYTTSIAAAPAQCLLYEQQGRPPAEICANEDAVPVKLSTQLAKVYFTFQAKGYRRGVDSGAFTPPAPV